MKMKWYSLMAVALCVAAASLYAEPETKPVPKPTDPADSAALKGDIPRIQADTKGKIVKTEAKAKQDTVTTKSGLKYIDVVVGTGTMAENMTMPEVHYTGWLSEKGVRGRKIDSSVDRNSPLSFLIGAGAVIKGWEEGVTGMKVGGKRTLIIKPELAWGALGYREQVPPNATVIFDIELLGVKPMQKAH